MPTTSASSPRAAHEELEARARLFQASYVSADEPVQELAASNPRWRECRGTYGPRAARGTAPPAGVRVAKAPR